MTARQSTVSREALGRLPTLDLRELRQQWRGLYKTEAPAQFSRDLLADASCRLPYAGTRFGRPAPGAAAPAAADRTGVQETGSTTIRARPELKPGTRLIREWQGRTYEVLVLDDGFSWQNTRYRSLSAIARTITGTPWSGPLFFGLKPNRCATRLSTLEPGAPGGSMEGADDAG